MKNVTTGFPDPSQPDDQNTHDESPFRAPRGGDRTWNTTTPGGKSPRRDRGGPSATPPPEVVALWNTPPEPPVARGDYRAVITRTFEGETASGKLYYALIFRIIHGPHIGRCFEYRLWLTDNARTHTKACCAKFGIYHVEELYQSKLNGRLCTIFIDAKNNVPETEIKAFDPIHLPALNGERGEGGEPCGAD